MHFNIIMVLNNTFSNRNILSFFIMQSVFLPERSEDPNLLLLYKEGVYTKWYPIRDLRLKI